MAASATNIDVTSRESHLSDNESIPYTIHGVAIGPDDVTVGSSGIKKFWPSEELQEAAETLENEPLVHQHENNGGGVVGRVTKAGWDDEFGVIYEAELYDSDIAEQVQDGDIEVSVRGRHIPVEQMEEREDDDALVVEEIVFENLSTVYNGASPSNTANMGEHDELSYAELSASLDAMDSPDDSELVQVTTGDWVQWDDGETHGIVREGPELQGRGAPQLEIYEKTDDGEWYPTGTIETGSERSLEEWDVDLENITTPPEESDEESSEASEWSVGDKVSWHSGNGVIKDIEDRFAIVEPYAKDGDVWAPTSFEVEVDMNDLSSFDFDDQNFDTRGKTYTETEEENMSVSDGDYVKWDTAGGTAHGQIVSTKESGCYSDSIKGSQEICAPEDEESVGVARIEIFKEGKGTDVHVAHHTDTLESWDGPSESENSGPPYNDGDFVQFRTRIGRATGEVVGRKENGCYDEELDGEVTVCAGADEAVNLIEVYNDGMGTGVHVAHKESLLNTWNGPTEKFNPETGERIDAEDPEEDDYSPDDGDVNTDSGEDTEETETDDERQEMYIPSEGDMVRWRVQPSMHGKVVHVDTEKNILMVSVMRGDEETGYTLTAGYEDVVPVSEDSGPAADTDMDEEESAEALEQLLMNSSFEAEDDELDDVYDEWDDAVNMTASELRKWSGHPCSREASLEPKKVIRRNLNLLETNKSDWGDDEIEDAKRTINFVNRMSGMKPDEPKDGTHGCPSDWAISMMNWAHNPFDSMPEVPDDEDLDEVDEVELGSVEGAEERSSRSDKANQPHRYPECEHGCPEEDCEKCHGELEADIKKPKFDGTTESESWDGHTLNDFTDEQWDDLDESEQRDIANHFLISRGGWPPENFSQLGFEVVDTDGNLDLQGLRAAKTRSGQAGSDVDEGELKEVINELATDNFDVDWTTDEEENTIMRGDVPSRSAVSESNGQTPTKVVKKYLYEKGKADGMYDSCSPHRSTEMMEDDGVEENSGQVAAMLMSREYNHEEMESYQDGYDDGASSKSELSKHGEHDSEEMMEAYAKGVHDGMDPDEPDSVSEASAHMPDAEQSAYSDGHSDGMSMRAKNEMPRTMDEDEHSGELAKHTYDSEEDAKEAASEMPSPCADGTSHYHEDEDVYMPCESHEQYEDAVEMNDSTDSENGGEESRDSDDLQHVTRAESKAGLAVVSNENTNMTVTDEELEEYDDPVVMERDEFEELQSMNEGIEELRERTEILDEVSRELVEELQEADEPLVIEEARFDELEDEAQNVKEIYASEVAEASALFSAEELVENHSLEELREKFDEIDAELAANTEEEEEQEEEELEAEPRGADVDGEGSEEEGEVDELEEKAEQKRAELREKLGIADD